MSSQRKEMKLIQAEKLKNIYKWGSGLEIKAVNVWECNFPQHDYVPSTHLVIKH